MSGRHDFRELTNSFTPERRKRVETRKAELRAAMPLHELRQARAMTQRALGVALHVSKQPPAKPVALPWPLKEAEFPLIVLFPSFFLFLVPHVATNLLLVHTYRAYAIATAPEPVSPIGTFLQSRKSLEQFDSRLALQDSHQFGHSNPRWYHHYQVHMIFHNGELDNLCSFPLAQLFHHALYVLCHRTFEYSKSVLGAPHHVI